jgi:prepilin-type N-terminal cleavage/methylation domain-containing protein
MTSKTGFTLIELLVVIGIIGILIAIAQPILTTSTAHTYEYQCESHLHQIGVAMTAYAQDNGVFPAALGRVDYLLQDKGLLVCPKTSRDYYYLQPPADADRDTIIAACVNPRTPAGRLPHRFGKACLTLTASGSVKRLIR